MDNKDVTKKVTGYYSVQTILSTGEKERQETVKKGGDKKTLDRAGAAELQGKYLGGLHSKLMGFNNKKGHPLQK